VPGSRIVGFEWQSQPLTGHRAETMYVGAGYWRLAPVWRGETLHGVHLINPDRTPDEIAAVERGIAIVLHCRISKEIS